MTLPALLFTLACLVGGAVHAARSELPADDQPMIAGPITTVILAIVVALELTGGLFWSLLLAPATIGLSIRLTYAARRLRTRRT